MCMLLKLSEAEVRKLPPQFAGYKGAVYIRGSAIRAIYPPRVETELEVMKSLCQKK